MTLLTIVQDVAREAGFAVPGSVVGNSDDTAQLIFQLANRSGKMLARKYWQALRKEHTFSFVASQETYAPPADLMAFMDYTAWDRTQFWSMTGSLTAQEWQRYKSGLQSTVPRFRFRYMANLIYIDPIPSDTDSIVIEYQSSYWVAVTAAPTVGVQTAFALDTDVSLIDEQCVTMDALWRFLERKGLAYEESKNEAQIYIDNVYANDTPKGPIDFSGDYDSVWPPLPTVPTTGYS